MVGELEVERVLVDWKVLVGLQVYALENAQAKGAAAVTGHLSHRIGRLPCYLGSPTVVFYVLSLDDEAQLLFASAWLQDLDIRKLRLLGLNIRHVYVRMVLVTSSYCLECSSMLRVN
jgi:hypothetical protein